MTESIDLTLRLRAWSYRRQCLGRTAREPAEALRSVVAVYSSHPTAPLSLLSRSQSFDVQSLSEMEQRREVLRIPAMRQSIFLIPAETAPYIFAATRLPLEKHALRLRYAGLDWDSYTRLKSQVLAHTQEPITASSLRKALNADESLVIALHTMAREGLVIRLGSSLRADALRYVATEAWLGHPLEDFAWWSGITRRQARAALADASIVDIGDGLLLPADQQTEFEHVEPIDPDAVDILPKWDAYTMGHAPDGRQRLVDDGHLGYAYSTTGSKSGATAGDGMPLVLLGGRAVARWSHRYEGARMLVEVAPFEPGSLPRGMYEHIFDEVGKLLGATAEVVETTSCK